MDTLEDAASLVQWGVASAPMPGQAESGDLHLVKPFGDGVLVAVVDGLGHGPEAAAAARAAVVTLEANAGEPVTALVNRCHEALKTTRGVVMSLASFRASDSTLTWLGVGNVGRARSSGLKGVRSCIGRLCLIAGAWSAINCLPCAPRSCP